jgi:cytosine/adenosine deaminase-related metal-dependent hydrolase
MAPSTPPPDHVDLVIRGANLLDVAHDGIELTTGDLVIAQGRIVDAGPGAADRIQHTTDEISGSGLLAMPGLVNCHFHSPGNLLKGAVQNLPLELFMLYEVPPFMKEPVATRVAYLRTMLGALEMLKQGVTAVHDDAFFLPIVTHPEIDAVMDAYRDSGLRAVVALDQPNEIEYRKHPFLESLLSEGDHAAMDSAARQTDAELLDHYQWFIERWNDSAGGRLGVAVSCSAPQRVTPDYLRALGDLSQRFDLPYNMHILETRTQRAFGDERLGHSLVKYAHEMGVLNERAQVIHSIWVDDADIDLLAASGCSVAHNPVSNLKIGSGIMPFRRIVDAGINVGLGTDEASVDDGVNYWTTMKVTGLIHNVGDSDYRRWPTPHEILRAATTGGSRAMRLDPQAGRLTPGAPADLVLLDLNTAPFTPLNNLERQLIYCEPRQSVLHTIIDGQVVVRDGRVQTFDEDAILGEVRDLAPAVSEFIADCTSGAAQMVDKYQQMYQLAVDHPVPMHRWAGPMTP